MAVQTLLWEGPVELAASGSVGGLAHYFNETAQALYIDGTAMATRKMVTPEGQYSALGDTITIQEDMAISGLRLDHPAFGILFASWVADEELTVAIYVYAADISDIIETMDVTEQIDNALKGLSMTLKNARSDLSEHDMSLISPGAAIDPYLRMGDSERYPMGRYYLDTGPHDPLAKTFQCAGFSRIGRLLKDTKFDLYGSTTQAIFTGTPEAIVTAIIELYSDGELTEDDIAVQADAGAYTASFDPKKSVLDGLTEWLETFRTPEGSSHDTLEYGATGDEVELAQTLLNNNMAPGDVLLVVDGIFGTKTRAAVRAFQTRKGLTVNGTVDASTWTALLGTQPGDVWLLAELYDGRIIVGDETFISGYRAVDRYTFTREVDVYTRKISRNVAGAYSRVGVKYTVTVEGVDTDAYVYSNVGTWPAWAVPSHKTYYIDAAKGATQAQAQALADKTAVQLQYAGIVEQLAGPIRPELLVGDIAQISDDGGETATVTGLITEVRHTMGEHGFFTQFSSDSGGAIMEVADGEETATITSARTHPVGANRKRRFSDTIRIIAARQNNCGVTIS